MPRNPARLVGFGAVMDGLEQFVDDWSTEASWVVGTNVQYAIEVHEGTSRMEGRPYLAVALDRVLSQRGDELADRADSAEELVELTALALEAETKVTITEMGAVDTGNLRSSIRAVRLS